MTCISGQHARRSQSCPGWSTTAVPAPHTIAGGGRGVAHIALAERGGGHWLTWQHQGGVAAIIWPTSEQNILSHEKTRCMHTLVLMVTCMSVYNHIGQQLLYVSSLCNTTSCAVQDNTYLCVIPSLSGSGASASRCCGCRVLYWVRSL